MATRKRKSSPAPLHWFQRLKHRLTGRLAFFIWGALFGNAVLVQTFSPWDLLTRSPESLLSQSWRSHLDAARQQVRVLAASLADEQRAHRESIAHLSEQLEKAHRDVAALSAEVAALTATIRKVKPIRAVG